MTLSEGAQAAQVRARDAPFALDLDRNAQRAVLLDQKIDLDSGVRAPEKQAGLFARVVQDPSTLENHPLLEETSAAHRIELGREAPIDGVGDARVEQEEPGVRDQTSPWALAPGLESESDQGVFQYFMIFLHGSRA